MLMEADRRWPDDSVSLVGVVYQDNRSNARSFMQRHGGDWTSILDPGTVTAIHTPCPDCRCGYGVTITGHDGHRYTYCHGRSLADHIQSGGTVAAGELIMLSGNTGNSTTPHLHFQIRNPQGVLVCPQSVLEAWWNGIDLNPAGAPTTGCTH